MKKTTKSHRQGSQQHTRGPNVPSQMKITNVPGTPNWSLLWCQCQVSDPSSVNH